MEKRLKLKKRAITTALTLMIAVTGCNQSKPAATEATTEAAATEATIEEELAVEDATAA